ncbi:AAA family ATPase [Saccharothrix sp. HUAS TT1]|uniref:AAA family ATPase n=1 Tax=unclassified Saccharothrix TaxID=2593673 RepID=UPI00345C0505
MDDAGPPRSADRVVGNRVVDATGGVVQAGTITGGVVFHGAAGAGFGPDLVSVVPPTFRLDGALHGRAELIRDLVRTVRAQRGAHVVLHGLGGSGKTTAALAVAARLARDSRDIRVWWLDASAEKALRAGFREVALEAGAPLDQVIQAWSGGQSAARVLRAALGNCAHPWVLVIDNADDERLLEPWWQPLAQQRGAVLVTTRDGRPVSWPNAELRGVGPLDEEEAVALLRALAPDSGTVKQARDLAGTLGHLPLTLHLAGRYLSAAKAFPPVPDVQLPQDFDSYRLVFRSDFGTLDELHGLDRALGPRELLTRTWEFTLDLLHELGHPLARPLLRWLSCFAQAPIPYTLVDARVIARSPLFAGATGRSVLRTLVALERFGLTENAAFRHVLSSSVTTDSLRLHPVIREANRHQPDFARDLREYIKVAVAVLDGFTSYLSIGVAEDMSRWAALSPHCEHVSYWIHQEQGVFSDDWALLATKLACTVARFAQVTEDHMRAEVLFNHALVVRVRLLGEDHPEVLGVRREVAWLHWNNAATDQDRFRQCVDEYEVLTRRCRDTLGEQDPLTLLCRFDLALVRSHDSGGPSVAEHYRDVVRLGRQVFGGVERIGFTTQVSLVGHLWRRMHRAGAADHVLEEEIVRLITMVDEMDGDESTRDDLPLAAEDLRARFTGMLESCVSWNARFSDTPGPQPPD